MEAAELGRIDRAVADNIKDIERSFGAQAGLVQDFIVFISRRVQVDLFGFTRFTVADFCKCSGRSRQDLSVMHPDIVSGKITAPVVEGYAFRTVLDYALYSMLERNIIFSNRYELRSKESVLSMHSFPILKDLRLNFGRGIKELKVYEVRLSDELLQGFLSRYYTVNTESYKLVGKGRGGDGRKRLLLYLSKLSHVVLSSGLSETLVPLDRLCEFGGIRDERPSHRKQNLVRVLEHLICVGRFAFGYEFVLRKGYMVRLVFKELADRRGLIGAHNFYFRLLTGLRSAFEAGRTVHADFGPGAQEKDPFQAWLADPDKDLELKARVLMQSHYAALGVELSFGAALEMVRSGRLSL